MKDTYFTIQNESTGLYKEKGSKFISFAYPVENEMIAKEKINILRKKFHDATHHCFAYVLGENQEIYRVHDDGEPSHSAGIPIWGQIRSFQLTNTLIVVVRYYGGVNLGVSGLVNAYKTAANLALEQAKIIEKIVTQNFELQFQYINMNDVMKLIKEFDGKILEQTMDLDCRIQVAIRKKEVDNFKKKANHFLKNEG
jgi:uncharacterized YigZ family protein